MNVAIIQPVAGQHAKRFPYRHEVAALGAALRMGGHVVTLTILDTCDEPALAAAMQTQPGAVFIYVESLAADLAQRIAGAMAAPRGAILVPFGPHASLRPDECLSMTGAEAVAVAPADITAPAYLAAQQTGLDHVRTPGFWVKCETGVMRNPAPRPPESPACWPPPARDLYPFETIVDAAGMAHVCVARGGEGGAAPASAPAAMHAEPGAWPGAAWPVLHRPVDAIIDEMLLLADEHLDLGGFRIGNERWLSRLEWAAEFAARVAREVAIPLRTCLYAPDVTPAAAAILARAGCEEARIPLGSGSALIRNEVLGLAVTDEAAAAALAALRHAGVPSVACIEIGAAYETWASLDQTVEFLRRTDPDRVEAVLHYPVPGTPAERIARENGWLVADPAAAHLAGKPAVSLPQLSADDIVTACETLPYAIHRPHIVPLIRMSRRVRIGRRGTLYDLVVKPMLAPPKRRTR